MTNQVGVAEQGVKINSAGINLGYGNVKVQTDQGYFQYISDTAPARDRKTRERFGIEDARTQLVTYEGKMWEVGDGAGLLAAPRQLQDDFPFLGWHFALHGLAPVDPRPAGQTRHRMVRDGWRTNQRNA
jgi:hypothetical protein